MAAGREYSMLSFQGKREKKAVCTSNVDGAGVCDLVVLVMPLVVVVAVHGVVGFCVKKCQMATK